MLELACVQKLHEQGHGAIGLAVAMLDHANLAVGDAQEAGEFGLTVPAPLPNGLEGGWGHLPPFRGPDDGAGQRDENDCPERDWRENFDHGKSSLAGSPAARQFFVGENAHGVASMARHDLAQLFVASALKAGLARHPSRLREKVDAAQSRDILGNLFQRVEPTGRTVAGRTAALAAAQNAPAIGDHGDVIVNAANRSSEGAVVENLDGIGHFVSPLDAPLIRNTVPIVNRKSAHSANYFSIADRLEGK